MPEQQQFGASGPYFVARDQLPNPFAAFWHAYLAQYNPKAMAAFTARLRALDPSEQLRYVAALEESKTRLLEAQAANERSVRNAVLQEGLSEDESARLAAQLDMQARGQDTDLAVARIGQQTELTKAGTLSDEGRRIANDLQTRVNAAQRYALETGDLAGMQTQIEQATVKAQADAQNLAPMERTVGLPNAIDGMLSGSMISDPAVRADIRAIVAPAFGRPSSVPTTGAGVRAPRTAEQIRDFASTLRGGGPSAAATAPATSSPAPAGQGAGTPVPSPGTGGGSGNAVPAGSDAELKQGVKEIEGKQAAAAAAPKFGALGGFTDPLPLSEEEQRRWIRAHPGMAREMAGQARPTRIARKLAQARRGASTEPAEAASKLAEPSAPNPLEGYKVTPGDFPEAAKKFAAAKQEKPPTKPGGKPVDKVQATIDAALPPQSDTTVDEFGQPLQSEQPTEAKVATPASREGLMQRLARAAGVEVDASTAAARRLVSSISEKLPDYRSGNEPLPEYREALPTGGGADAIDARKKLLDNFRAEREKKSEQEKGRSAGRKLPKSG